LAYSGCGSGFAESAAGSGIMRTRSLFVRPMKSIVLGNPNADSWRLALDDVSAREHVIALKGELRAGFFHAVTPMCIAPEALSRFATDLRELDNTLKGSVTLDNRSRDLRRREYSA